MAKYKIIGKFHMTPDKDGCVELSEAEGDGFVALGRLEKVEAKPKQKPRRTRKKANG